MMGKYLVSMRYLISTICIVLLLWGCDRTVDATAKPKVVHKKVVVKKEQTTKVRTNQRIHNARTTDATSQPKVVRKKVVVQKEQTAKVRTNQTARLEKKISAAKTDKVQAKAKNQVVTKIKTDEQAMAAKKREVIPARDAVTKLAKPKKPAVRPRSDISEMKQPPTDDSTLSSDKLVVATANVTPKMRLAAIPGVYNAIGKIDPFEPLFREKPVSVKKKTGKKRIPQTPLERIDLSQLKLVGIILATSGNRALVEESSGKGYVIKKGTYIGVNSGKVVKIKKEKVVVEEEFEDVFGKSKLRQREIKLPKPPGEF
jgi:type IV pilus assembly protein PilP